MYNNTLHNKLICQLQHSEKAEMKHNMVIRETREIMQNYVNIQISASWRLFFTIC